MFSRNMSFGGFNRAWQNNKMLTSVNFCKDMATTRVNMDMLLQTTCINVAACQMYCEPYCKL